MQPVYLTKSSNNHCYDLNLNKFKYKIGVSWFELATKIN
jgi:hypothetical protein